MPTSCSALRCTNRQKKGSGITFHSFPNDPVRRQKWVLAMGRNNWIPSVHASLCSVHFEEKCFDRTGQTVRLRDGSVPSVFVSPMNFKRVKKVTKTNAESVVKQEKEVAEKVTLLKRPFVPEDEPTGVQELDKEDHTYPKRIHLSEARCFVCDKAVGNGTPLHCLTNTTKVQMHHKLDKIVASELNFFVNEEEVLCSRCTRLLNYVDRIEVELTMLNRSVLNCIRGKHILGLRGEELLDKLPEFDDNLFGIVPVTSYVGGDDCSSSDVCISQIKQLDGKCDASDKREDGGNVTQQHYCCETCDFKTRYKSVMIYHLRHHLRPTYCCDFCNSSLPEAVKDRASEDCHLPLCEADVNADRADVVVETQGTSCSELDDAANKVPYLACPVTKESDLEVKNNFVNSMSVENMLEELHKTGQISAFVNSGGDWCKGTNILTKEAMDVNNETSEISMGKCSLVKMELMNVDASDEMKVRAQEISCQNQVFVDFAPVKSETQSATSGGTSHVKGGGVVEMHI